MKQDRATTKKQPTKQKKKPKNPNPTNQMPKIYNLKTKPFNLLEYFFLTFFFQDLSSSIHM